MRNTKWTEQEDQFLLEKIKQNSGKRIFNYKSISKILNRTEKAIKLRVGKIRKNQKNLFENIPKQKKVSGEYKVWSEKEQNLLISKINQMNKFKSKNDFIEHIASLTGFSKTTVFERIKNIQKNNVSVVKITKKKTQVKKETPNFFKRLKYLFFPNN